MWVVEKSLLQECLELREVPEHEATEQLYWEEGGGWIWEAFNNLLTSSSQMQIASSFVDPNSVEPDKFGWLDVRGNSFSVSSAYVLGA